jgi:hypothetical protein
MMLSLTDFFTLENLAWREVVVGLEGAFGLTKAVVLDTTGLSGFLFATLRAVLRGAAFL